MFPKKKKYICVCLSLFSHLERTLLEKAEIPTEFRDRIIFVSNRDEIGDGKRH